MKKRIIALTLLLALTLAITSGCAAQEASEQTVWRFGHEETVGAIQDIYAHEFKRLVEERTDGEITVEIYRTGEISLLEKASISLFAREALMSFAWLSM